VDRCGCGEHDILPAPKPSRRRTARAIGCVAPRSRRRHVRPHGMQDRARTTAGTTRLRSSRHSEGRRVPARSGASLEEEGADGGQDQDGTPDYDRQIKAGLAVGRMCLIQNRNSYHALKWRLALAAKSHGKSEVSAPAASEPKWIGTNDGPRRQPACSTWPHRRYACADTPSAELRRPGHARRPQGRPYRPRARPRRAPVPAARASAEAAPPVP
jgi:hypothetical protein